MTGGNLSPGVYPLITAPDGGLAGSFQFDGGENLAVPATSQIKQVGGAWYRLTLQNSATAEQVVVVPAPAHVVNILPLGSSSAAGFSAVQTYNGGGYRSGLYQALVNDGRFTPNFVGSETLLAVRPPATLRPTRMHGAAFHFTSRISVHGPTADAGHAPGKAPADSTRSGAEITSSGAEGV